MGSPETLAFGGTEGFSGPRTLTEGLPSGRHEPRPRGCAGRTVRGVELHRKKPLHVRIVKYAVVAGVCGIAAWGLTGGKDGINVAKVGEHAAADVVAAGSQVAHIHFSGRFKTVAHDEITRVLETARINELDMSTPVTTTWLRDQVRTHLAPDVDADKPLKDGGVLVRALPGNVVEACETERDGVMCGRLSLKGEVFHDGPTLRAARRAFGR